MKGGGRGPLPLDLILPMLSGHVEDAGLPQLHQDWGVQGYRVPL